MRTGMLKGCLLDAQPVRLTGSGRFGSAFTADNLHIFLPLVVLAQALGAFASTSGAHVNGSIPAAFIRAESRADVALVDVKMAEANQAALVQVVSHASCITYLAIGLRSQAMPSLNSLLISYGLCTALSLASAIGVYLYMPPLATEEQAEDETVALRPAPEAEGAQAVAAVTVTVTGIRAAC